MRTVDRNGSDLLPDGSVVAGYTVDGAVANSEVSERRYAVRGPGGSRATLIAGRERLAGRAARSRFRRLAARRMELDHPAAIRVLAVTEYDGRGVLITDEYPAYSLGDLLERGAPLPPERAMPMLVSVAEALDAAHARGLVHRRLGAASLLLPGRERVMLDVFGILDGDGGIAWTGQAGDVRYAAPEALRGEPLEPLSNVYSLGAVIVHALTGEPPFPGDRAAVVYGHMSDPPPRVSDRVPALGGEADEVIARALAKDPSGRPHSAGALVLELSRALGLSGLDVAASPRVHAAQPPRERRGRRRAVAIAGIVAALGAGALAGTAAAPFGGDEPARATAPASDLVWAQLGERRAALRAELAAARVPAAQARAAAGLADLFSRAGRTRGALGAAADDVATAYTRLETAARADDRDGYATAADEVSRAEAQLSLAASRN